MHDMTFRSLNMVDPELRDFLTVWPISDISAAQLATLRQTLLDNLAATAVLPNENIRREILQIPGPAGAPSIRVLVNSPSKKSSSLRPGYFQIHGGGFIMGVPEMTEARNQAIAQELDYVVFSPSYRLAPEVKFPGAIEDCYAALKYFHENAAQFGVDPNRIIIGGESAGGGLAASLVILVRDRGEFTIAGQLLVYPMLDDRTGTTTQPDIHLGEFIWTRTYNSVGWSCILDCEPGSDGVSPYAAAAREADLSGLPSTHMLVGALDLFLDENLIYAQRLIAAGIPLGLRVYPGAYHGFDMVEASRLGRQFKQDYFNALIQLTENHE